MIRRWVLEGELDDVYEEFFISADLSVGDEGLWRDCYKVRQSHAAVLHFSGAGPSNSQVCDLFLAVCRTKGVGWKDTRQETFLSFVADISVRLCPAPGTSLRDSFPFPRNFQGFD